MDTKKNSFRPKYKHAADKTKADQPGSKQHPFLWCYLFPGRLQLDLQPRFVLAEVLELLLSFISELKGLQVVVGLWGSRVKGALWFGQDLLPLNPKDQHASVGPVTHDEFALDAKLEHNSFKFNQTQ